MSDLGAGVMMGVVTTLFVVLMAGISMAARTDNEYIARCAAACKAVHSAQLSRIDGVCTCRNGNVFAWSEGYSVKVGGKR